MSMEFEYHDPSRRGKLIVILGVIMAIIAGAGAFFLLSQAQQQAGKSTLQTVAIVVAAKEIPVRKVIELGDLTLREVPADETVAQGVYADPAKLVGLVAGTSILPGQPIFANMLAGQTVGSQFTILSPTETVGPDSPAWRAVSITVPDDRAVGGFLQAGQTVDIFVTSTVAVPEELVAEGRYFTDKATKIVYQDMLLLAKTATSYVIKASVPVAEEIAHLQASGAAAFSLALRPDQDFRAVDASDLGTTTTRIVARYGLPLPEWYPPGRGPAALPTPTAAPSAAPAAAGTPAPTPTPGSDESSTPVP